LGYRATTFESAQHFLGSSMLVETTCLITDVQMPGLSGLELQEALQSQGYRTPVILITAYPNEKHRARALDNGAVGFLSKPFDEEPLIKCLSAAITSRARAVERFITLGSTTSIQDSGLLGHILPLFKAASGIDVHVVAVGTGQALAMGTCGDSDALLVHDRAGEDKFVADGFGIDRRDVMYNDFVIVGPGGDPAHIRGLKNARQALLQIAEAAAPFASRGDDSGTNRMELRLWKAAGITPDPRSGWYRDLGQGMGATLNIAAAMNAYALTDRATRAKFQEQARSGNPYRSRPGFVKSLWQHSGEFGEVAEREIWRCEDLARMAHYKAWARCDRVVPYQRRGSIFPAARFQTSRNIIYTIHIRAEFLVYCSASGRKKWPRT
jgi:ABC-type tungstate transport system permease subunit